MMTLERLRMMKISEGAMMMMILEKIMMTLDSQRMMVILERMMMISKNPRTMILEVRFTYFLTVSTFCLKMFLINKIKILYFSLCSAHKSLRVLAKRQPNFGGPRCFTR